MSRVIFGISTELLGGAIKALRRDLGLSQDRLARELGCSVAAVQQWERNRNRPSLAAIEKMSRLAKEAGLEKPFPSPGKSSHPAPHSGGGRALRAYNDSLMGLKLLRRAAEGGSSAALECLLRVADEITRLAGHLEKYQ